MVNIIGYNQFPDKNEFIELYKNNTQLQLSNYYGCTKKRINKWIKHFGLELRPQGGGNNRKYDIDEIILRKLIDNGYSNDEICNDELLEHKLCEQELCEHKLSSHKFC